MEFIEMCRDLLNGNHLMAVRKSYPDITTTVRVRKDIQGEQLLTYYSWGKPEIPVVISKSIAESDDWIVFDEFSTRFNITNFIEMPNAKQFIKELWESVSSENYEGNFTKGFTDRPYYAQRFDEARSLDLIVADPKKRTIEFTDLGRALAKTL